MSQLVGTSKFGSNADTSLSVDQHYSDRQDICYEPSPYAAFLAYVHSIWKYKEPSFVEWIAVLSSRPKYKKLTSAGLQLCQTFQSELRGQSEPDTRFELCAMDQLIPTLLALVTLQTFLHNLETCQLKFIFQKFGQYSRSCNMARCRYLDTVHS